MVRMEGREEGRGQAGRTVEFAGGTEGSDRVKYWLVW